MVLFEWLCYEKWTQQVDEIDYYYYAMTIIIC